MKMRMLAGILVLGWIMAVGMESLAQPPAAAPAEQGGSVAAADQAAPDQAATVQTSKSDVFKALAYLAGVVLLAVLAGVAVVKGPSIWERFQPRRGRTRAAPPALAMGWPSNPPSRPAPLSRGSDAAPRRAA